MRELTELEQQTVEEELLNIPTPSTSILAGKDKVPGALFFNLNFEQYDNSIIYLAKVPAATKKKVDDDEDELRRMADWAS
jgi:hypothetical protein